MKNKVFLTRMINLLLVVGLLLGYQSVLAFREKTETIGYLENELAYYTAKEVQESKAAAEAKIAQAEQAQQSDMAAEIFSKYKDGTYTGDAEGFGGNIQVQVIINAGQIADIQILSAKQEDTAYLEMAMDVVDAMLSAQSDEVDTVSGATFTSTGIKNAVHQALEQAGN